MAVYSNTVCPICGKSVEEVMSWVHCPKYKALVCMAHCYQDCGQMSEEISVMRCTFAEQRQP